MKRLVVLALVPLMSCSDPLVPQQHARGDSHSDTYRFMGSENPRIRGLVEAGVSDLAWAAGRAQVRIGFRGLDKAALPIRLNTAEMTLEVRPTGTILKPVENTIFDAQTERQWVGVSFTAPPLLSGQHFRMAITFRDSDNAVTSFEFEFGP